MKKEIVLTEKIKMQAKLSANENESIRKCKLMEVGLHGLNSREEQRAENNKDTVVAFEKIPGMFNFFDLENQLFNLTEVGLSDGYVRQTSYWYFGIDYPINENIVVYPKCSLWQ